LGIAIFERFFEKIVDLCQEAGLVGVGTLLRSTKVERTGIPSLIPVSATGGLCATYS
jgi:hypothetical protein